MNKRLRIFALISVFLLTIPNAKATVIVADDGWHIFQFPGLLSPTLPNPASPDDYSWFESFEFTLLQPALLTVQDLGDNVDQFEVYDNGSLIFTTSDPIGSNIGNFFDPDLAASIPELSRGSFLLMPGDHKITGVNIRYFSFDGDGSAALRLDTISINEPNVMSLLIISLLIWAAVNFFQSKLRPINCLFSSKQNYCKSSCCYLADQEFAKL